MPVSLTNPDAKDRLGRENWADAIYDRMGRPGVDWAQNATEYKQRQVAHASAMGQPNEAHTLHEAPRLCRARCCPHRNASVAVNGYE